MTDSDESPPDLSDDEAMRSAADAALVETAAAISWRARRFGTTIVTADEEGRIVELTPDEFDRRRAANAAASRGRQPPAASAAE